MGWGTSANVTQVHLAASTDDPSQARAEIYNAFTELKAVIDGRNTANGIPGLDGSSKISASQIPDELNSSTATDLTLAPDTGRVVFQDFLFLTPKTVAELSLITTQAGDVAYCSDGDAGSPCIAIADGTTDSNGSVWYRISLGSQIST